MFNKRILTGPRMSVAGVFREREEDEFQRQQVVDRWQNAGHSILSSVRMVRNAETLGDKFASGAERYVHCTSHAICSQRVSAAVSLCWRLT